MQSIRLGGTNTEQSRLELVDTADQLGAGAHAELAVNPGEMDFHSLGADEQRGPHGAVAHSRRGELGNPPLPRGYQFCRAAND